MHSIKPGRGPSCGGAIGGIIAAIFGVFWVFAASSMGAPSFFVLFGIVFILAAIGGAIYNFYNATSRNRFSHFDITGPNEERDPLDGLRSSITSPPIDPDLKSKFCPYCGTQLQKTFEFCPQCGKDI